MAISTRLDSDGNMDREPAFRALLKKRHHHISDVIRELVDAYIAAGGVDEFPLEPVKTDKERAREMAKMIPSTNPSVAGETTTVRRKK